ncbi:MAG: GerMN domain-containing protein [Clostridium cadaveris]|uniref:Sporulation/spore germination protein n=1 Tax=Clostridium cadaveris TaxID=1529 RepID=A0A316M220_9CLOT|nr:GerMN domain-containing protein [Clostridium cadaveris]MDU4951193.1 GerMN domain-containing protein [Clostridium sp.]MDY4950591.1 GerMN domain-containing protein [Clostridium cadaveris]PWL52181.1 MAG: sporulation/spore germination protein [Clostridium cadaveris]UFH64905.1 GerMN domain-containing protein [Clostridium cadaveris]
MKNILKKTLFLTMTIISLTLMGCNKADKVSINNKDKIKNMKLLNEENNLLDLELYFDDSTDESKAKIGMEELVMDKEEVVGETLVNSLIAGPSLNSKLKPILPKDTRLLSFSIKDDIAVVNLNSQAIIKMSVTKEEACIKGIVNTLCQLPKVNKVKFLIENKDIETIGGNYNTMEPIGKDDILKIIDSK